MVETLAEEGGEAYGGTDTSAGRVARMAAAAQSRAGGDGDSPCRPGRIVCWEVQSSTGRHAASVEAAWEAARAASGVDDGSSYPGLVPCDAFQDTVAILRHATGEASDSQSDSLESHDARSRWIGGGSVAEGVQAVLC